MTQYHDLSTPGGWWLAVAGWLQAGWQLAAGDMPPLSAALTLATLALTIIKVADAWRRYRHSDPTRGRWRRLRESVRTRPAPIYPDDTRPPEGPL